MATATYQRQRVIAAATARRDYFLARIDDLHREEREALEPYIQKAMRPRWWRRARTREEAERIVSDDYVLWGTGPFLRFYPSERLHEAEDLLRLAQTADGDTVTLTQSDVSFLGL